MLPKLSKDQRVSLIKRVIDKKEPVSRVCQDAGVSRTVFYRWLRRYKQEGKAGPKKQDKVRQGGRVDKEVVKQIISLIKTHPPWSSHKISQKLKVSNHGAQNVLQRLNLNTQRKREAFAEKAKDLNDEEALKWVEGLVRQGKGLVKPDSLSAQQRLKMIEQVVRDERSVVEVCRDFGVSRPVFYKWLGRYMEADKNEKLRVLRDKKPEIERHYRQVVDEYEQMVLELVKEHPEYGIRRILRVLPQVEGKPVVGYHGVQNVLKRHDLNVYASREAYARDHREVKMLEPVFEWLTTRLKLVWDKFIPSLAPAPPPTTREERIRRGIKYFAGTFLLTVVLGVGITGWVRMIGAAASVNQGIGLALATIALTMGSIFFIYSLKYYLTLAIVLSYSQREGEGVREERKAGLWGWLLGKAEVVTRQQGPVGLEPDLEKIKLKKWPMVSVQIPFYNEKKVVERAIEAATSFDYPNYEVMLLDDSTDETPKIIAKQQKKFLKKGQKLKVTKGKGWTLTEVEIRKGVYLKHLHRTSRKGFKGGALGQALKLMDPRVEMVTVFDADFVPYPDTLELFLKYFKAQNQMKEDYTKSNVAVVQGYQWHVLNKSENWITRGVRSEYAGSYVIERSGAEIYGGLKQISGSVYMIRRDVLEELGWKTSITEDFQLTLRLYEKGYKVVYTPYIQAPAECVSTLKRLIRQRMRWAEGHSQNIKKMFWRLMRSSKLSLTEKLETIYLSPYYLQAFFFLVGTLSWLMTETVFPAKLPFWTVLWGWSLVLTNMISLPLMNAAGMFLEESEEKDYVGLASFVALSYIVVPFQAYAAFKGFIEKEEGPWFRTPKTGRITDVLKRGTFYRFISGILPGKPAAEAARVGMRPAFAPAFMNKYMALATANNQFDSFRIRPRRLKWVSKVALAVLLAFTVTVYSATKGVIEVQATDVSQYWFRNDTSDEDGVDLTAGVAPLFQIAGESMQSGQNSVNATQSIKTTDYYWYSRELPTEMDDAVIPADGGGTYALNIYMATAVGAGKSETWDATIGYCHSGTGDPCGTGATHTPLDSSLEEGPVTFDSTDAAGQYNYTWAGVDGTTTCTAAAPCRIYIRIDAQASSKGGAWNLGYNNTSGNYQTNWQTPGGTSVRVPENSVYLLAAAPFIPLMVLWMEKRKKGLVYA